MSGATPSVFRNRPDHCEFSPLLLEKFLPILRFLSTQRLAFISLRCSLRQHSPDHSQVLSYYQNQALSSALDYRIFV